MPPNAGKKGSFLEELRRRKVFRVAIVYAAVAWVVVQAASIMAPALHLPEWTTTLVVLLAILGFPISLVLAWAFEVTPEGVRRTASGGREHRPLPRAARGAVSAVVALSLLAGGWYVWRVRFAPADGPEPSRSVIAILPFSVQGNEDVSYLEEGMVSLLATKLDGAGDLRSVDSRALLSQVERVETVTLDPRSAGEIATRLGAGLYVMGDVVESGGRVQIGASLYDATRGGERIGEGHVEGSSDEIFEVVDQLAAQLLTSLSGGSEGARVNRLAAVTTSSLPALKAYLEGDAALRDGAFEDAVAAFQRAVEADSTFALGYYRLSIAAEWATQGNLAHSAARDAVRHADRLTPRDRNLLEALRAFREGSFDEAEDLYRSILGTYPDDVEARLELGEVLFHTNAFRGRSFTEARDPFERALTYEPDNGAALIHLARIAAYERRLEDLDMLVARNLARSPEGERSLAMRALQAFSYGDEAAIEAMVAELDEAGGIPLSLAIWDVALYTGDLRGAERLARLLAAPHRSRDERALGYGWLVHMLTARGRWAEAKRELVSMEAVHGSAVEYRALLSSLTFLPVERPELEAAREALRRLDPATIPRSESPSVFFSVHDGHHPLLKTYLLGVLGARLGDRQEALSLAAQVEDMDGPDFGASLTEDLAMSIRAQLERTEGRPAQALATLERTRLQLWYEPTITSPFMSEALERFVRAELLYETGRYDDAKRWYSNLVTTSPFEIVYLPVIHLRLGDIEERAGDTQAAAAHYRRFVELWRNCDPELRPLRAEGEAALARLR